MRLIDKDELIKSLRIPEDMKCNNCEWRDSTYGVCTRDGLADACFFIENAEEVGRWIPCSERLPEEDDRYIVTLGGGITTVDSRGFYDGRWCDDRYVPLADQEQIVAWMPRPEPYKEGEGNGRS